MQPGCHQWSRCWIEWSPKSLSVHTLRMWTAVLAAECDDWTLPKNECRSARTKIGVHHHHHSNLVNVIIALPAVWSILLEYTDHYSMSRSTAFLRFKKLGFADKVVVGTIVIILNIKWWPCLVFCAIIFGAWTLLTPQTTSCQQYIMWLVQCVCVLAFLFF